MIVWPFKFRQIIWRNLNGHTFISYGYVSILMKAALMNLSEFLYYVFTKKKKKKLQENKIDFFFKYMISTVIIHNNCPDFTDE